MKTPRILVFGGSLRAASFNQKIAALAAQGARDAGADVTLIALRDFPLPLFDEDLESASGMPENAKNLKDLFLAHDGLIIASPEYNGSFSAILKNSIDGFRGRQPRTKRRSPRLPARPQPFSPHRRVATAGRADSPNSDRFFRTSASR